MSPLATYLVAGAMLLASAMNFVAAYKLNSTQAKVDDMFCIEGK